MRRAARADRALASTNPEQEFWCGARLTPGRALCNWVPRARAAARYDATSAFQLAEVSTYVYGGAARAHAALQRARLFWKYERSPTGSLTSGVRPRPAVRPAARSPPLRADGARRECVRLGCPVSARVRVLGGHRVVSFAREFIDEFRGKGRIVDAEAGRGKKTNDQAAKARSALRAERARRAWRGQSAAVQPLVIQVTGTLKTITTPHPKGYSSRRRCASVGRRRPRRRCRR